MNKLYDLRTYLLKRVPTLSRDPERLLTFVESGQITAHDGDNYSHHYTMPVRIVVTDWAKSADDIVIPLLEWIKVREPGYNPHEVLRFDTDILDNEKMDLLFELQITERVIVDDSTGSRNITHVLPEQSIAMDDGATLQTTASGPSPEDSIAESPE
ncbi:MAG: phage tail protein [Pseudomonadota bacterium]